MGTKKFNSKLKSFLKLENQNIRFINASANLQDKSNFIHTCDAMLHSRLQGESFGLAIGEFALQQKPVICYKNDQVLDRAHYDFLGDQAIYFSNEIEFQKVLQSLDGSEANLPVCEHYQREMNPVAVMSKFQEVFINEDIS